MSALSIHNDNAYPQGILESISSYLGMLITNVTFNKLIKSYNKMYSELKEMSFDEFIANNDIKVEDIKKIHTSLQFLLDLLSTNHESMIKGKIDNKTFNEFLEVKNSIINLLSEYLETLELLSDKESFEILRKVNKGDYSDFIEA